MKFLKAFGFPKATRVRRAYGAPDAANLARLDEFKGARMFARAQLLFRFRRGIGRNGYFKVDQKKHPGLLTVRAPEVCSASWACVAWVPILP